MTPTKKLKVLAAIHSQIADGIIDPDDFKQLENAIESIPEDSQIQEKK